MIALLCDSREAELTTLLSAYDEVKVFHQSGHITDMIRQKVSYQLIVVALDGAKGMNAASHRHPIPVLWITEQPEFFAQSKRINVAGFLVKPVTDQIISETVRTILTNIEEKCL